LGAQASEVGYPTSDTFPLTSSVSARSLFQRGAIYWKPELGARVVKGPIYDKYVSLGREHWLGFPTSDTGPTTTGYGQATNFEYGVIYHHVNLGAHVVYGAIPRKLPE